MRQYSFINTTKMAPGSFILLNAAKPKQVVANIIPATARSPKYVRAPGTFARIVIYGARRYIQLNSTHLRQESPDTIVQIGVNAAHNHRHRNYGGAGYRRQAGYHPRTRMCAKNPTNRTSLRYRLKTYNYSGPR